MSNKAKQLWAAKPDDHDYLAAEDYLGLIYPPKQAKAMVAALRLQPMATRKAKDLLRASRLPILDRTNVHVAKDLKKIADGEPLSPVLLIRGDGERDCPLQVADGYHRICASWHVEEDADITCQIGNAS